MGKRFIQNLNLKRGALHRQLGIKESKGISANVLREIERKEAGQKLSFNNEKITPLLKKRASLAYNFRKFKK